LLNPLPESMEQLEKQNILQWRKEILQPVKKYINQNLDPRKHNFFTEILKILNNFPLLMKSLVV